MLNHKIVKCVVKLTIEFENKSLLLDLINNVKYLDKCIDKLKHVYSITGFSIGCGDIEIEFVIDASSILVMDKKVNPISDMIKDTLSIFYPTTLIKIPYDEKFNIDVADFFKSFLKFQEESHKDDLSIYISKQTNKFDDFSISISTIVG